MCTVGGFAKYVNVVPTSTQIGSSLSFLVLRIFHFCIFMVHCTCYFSSSALMRIIQFMSGHQTIEIHNFSLPTTSYKKLQTLNHSISMNPFFYHAYFPHYALCDLVLYVFYQQHLLSNYTHSIEDLISKPLQTLSHSISIHHFSYCAHFCHCTLWNSGDFFFLISLLVISYESTK